MTLLYTGTSQRDCGPRGGGHNERGTWQYRVGARAALRPRHRAAPVSPAAPAPPDAPVPPACRVTQTCSPLPVSERDLITGPFLVFCGLQRMKLAERTKACCRRMQGPSKSIHQGLVAASLPRELRVHNDHHLILRRKKSFLSQAAFSSVGFLHRALSPALVLGAASSAPPTHLWQRSPSERRSWSPRAPAPGQPSQDTARRDRHLPSATAAHWGHPCPLWPLRWGRRAARARPCPFLVRVPISQVRGLAHVHMQAHGTLSLPTADSASLGAESARRAASGCVPLGEAQADV